jgi:hypothetical protein
MILKNTRNLVKDYGLVVETIHANFVASISKAVGGLGPTKNHVL